MGEPYWASEDGDVVLHLGDCLEVLRAMETDSIDAIVTDPPAGIAFMDREWDDFRRARNPADAGRDNVFGRTSARGPEYGRRDRRAFVDMLTERLAEAYRVLKPGGHALVWSIPRTSHWTAWAVEDAGFDLRDCVLHLFGSGFPKSLDVSKAIDRARNDRADILRVTSWLADAADASGIGRSQVDAHMGTSDMGGWWLSRLERRCAVPTCEQWQQLRGLIGFGDEMDAEVWRLNGRKGTPSEEWLSRPVADYENRPGMAESWTGGKGWTGTDARGGDAVRLDAVRWEGWGTALKPGQEMWWLARKPLKGTVAANVLEYGTGGLNVAACKVGSEQRVNNAGGSSSLQRVSRVESGYRPTVTTSQNEDSEVTGRWPTNIVFTHSAACEQTGVRTIRNPSGSVTGDEPSALVDAVYSPRERVAYRARETEAVPVFDCAPDCPVGELDRQSGGTRAAKPSRTGNAGRASEAGVYAGGAGLPRDYECVSREDGGGASRFYPTFRYQAKAPASERPRLEDGTAHETVKSLGLMAWMVKLITRPGGTVLDMFAGSGPVGEVCVIEGFRCVLIEQDPKSAELIKTRLRKPIQPAMFGLDEAS